MLLTDFIKKLQDISEQYGPLTKVYSSDYLADCEISDPQFMLVSDTEEKNRSEEEEYVEIEGEMVPLRRKIDSPFVLLL